MDSPLASDQSLILVVDDVVDNLSLLSNILEDAGFDVAQASSGERAWDQIQMEQPDLILLDIMMPGIGGFELCKRIQATPAFCDIPVIFMTALADVTSKVQGFSLGAADYITKPFEEAELLARVKNHLALRQAQARARRSEERLRRILNSLNDVVWSAFLDPCEPFYFNPAVEAISGYSSQALLQTPRKWFDMIYAEDRSWVETQLTNTYSGLQPLRLEYRIIRADDEIRWVQCQAQVRFDELAKRFRVDGILQDISDRKQLEQQLQHGAYHDSLTGLANRAQLMEVLNQLLGDKVRRRDEQFAMLLIDLDHFKPINDNLGHHTGDNLLKQVSEILIECTRPADLVARLGGDEFTILLRNTSDSQEVTAISTRIQEKFKDSIQIDGLNLEVTASIGMVLNSRDYESPQQMLQDADTAMYQAKRQGKARHHVFSEELETQ